MDALLSVNWIALLVLMIALLSFKALNWIAYRVNWTVVILISMVIGAVIGVVFASEGNTYLVWLNLIGQAWEPADVVAVVMCEANHIDGFETPAFFFYCNLRTFSAVN